MMTNELQTIVRRLTDDDPLGLGQIAWTARSLEERRFSGIWMLVPRTSMASFIERAGGDALILKIYRSGAPQRRQREFDDLTAVYQALGSEAGVVRPVACYAEHGAVITVRAPGVPLVRLVREACRRGADRELLARAAALCTTAGAWLRTFQQAGTARLGSARSEQLGNPDAFLAYVDERLRILRALRPGIEPSLHARLLAHAAATLHALPPRSLDQITWSHSDFGAHNLLAHGDKLHVLDFELAPQHPYFDVAYFVEALDHLSGPRIDASRVARLERAFLSGWGERTDVSLLALFRLRHLVCAYVSEARRGGMAQLRGWPGLLGMRARLRQLPLLLAQRPGTRAA